MSCYSLTNKCHHIPAYMFTACLSHFTELTADSDQISKDVV